MNKFLVTYTCTCNAVIIDCVVVEADSYTDALVTFELKYPSNYIATEIKEVNDEQR